MFLQHLDVIGEAVDVRQSRTLISRSRIVILLRPSTPGTKWSTVSLNLSSPESTSRNTAAAVNCIETDAIWNCVSAVFFFCCSRFANPYDFSKMTLSSSRTSTTPEKFMLST